MKPHVRKKMQFEEFQRILEKRYGQVLYDEKGEPESRWCEVAPNPRTGALLGCYVFKGNWATFFNVWKGYKREFEQFKFDKET